MAAQMTRSDPLLVSATTTTSYVDWPAIVAGAVTSASIALLLMTFGSAIGLSMTSPYRGEGVPATVFVAAIGLWTVWVTVSSMMAGGYIAGRMRRRIAEINEHEVDIRDGTHGFVVWALATLLTAWLATSATIGIAKGGAEIAKAGAKTAIAASVDEMGADPFQGAADTVMRSPGTASSAEIGRVLATNANKDMLDSADRQYLVDVIVARTNVTPEEAGARVDQAFADAKLLAAKAKAAADKARKVGVLVGFLTAASLLVAAAGAWWAAIKGGNHRDERTDFSRHLRWR